MYIRRCAGKGQRQRKAAVLDIHTNLYYDMDFRVVRLKIAENSYECIITNLDRNTFPPEKSKRCITCDRELKPLFVISSTPLDCLISIQKRWSSLSKKSMQDWFCTISVRPLPLTLLFRTNTANIHISFISQPLSIFADSSCWIAQCFLHPMLKLYSLSMCSLFAMDDTTLGKSKLVHLSASLTE